MFSESVVGVREHKDGWKIYRLWEVDIRKVTWKIRWRGKDNIDRQKAEKVREKTRHRDL